MVHVKETASRLVLTGPRDDLAKLATAFRLRPDRYFMSVKYQLYRKTKGKQGWDGYLYPLKQKGSTGVLARGLLDRLCQYAEQFDVPLNLSGILKRPFEAMTRDDVPTDLVVSEHPDYEHQRELVWQWVRKCIGVGEVTVSGGKTRAFCMAASLLRRKLTKSFRVLYLVPTERLVKQVYKDAREFLPGWNITQFGGSSRDKTGDLVVATYAIIGRNFVELQDWLTSFNVLLVDESHHAASPTLSKIIQSVPAYFKFGASDSVTSGDVVKDTDIEGLLGPVLMQMSAAPLIESDALAKPTIYVVDVQEWQDRHKDIPNVPDLNTPAWAYMGSEWKKATYLGPSYEIGEDGNPKVDKRGEKIKSLNSHQLMIDGMELDVDSKWCLLKRTYDHAIIRFRERNQLALDWATYFSKDQERTLMVATRTLHVLLLEAELKRRIDPDLVRILFSENTTKERDETFAWLAETPGSVLISPLVKEGVSIPELTAGVVVDYVGSISVARQIVGRFIRKKRHREANSAKVVWFVDRQVPAYRRGSLSLIGELERIRGYEFYHPCQGPDSVSTALKYEAR